MEKWKCPKCGLENDKNFNFCPGCGEKKSIIQDSGDNTFEGLDTPMSGNEDFSQAEINTSHNDKKSTPLADISVHITNDAAPIVLLFGPKSVGKTMTLVRLAKYLETDLKYSVDVDMRFCDTAWEYAENAKKFGEMKRTTKKLNPTNHNDFLFLKINNGARTICQILEAAGEHYFPSPNLVSPGHDRTNEPFPGYMNDVFNTNNKKVWIFMLNPKWTNQNDISDYVKRIRYCANHHFNEDKDRCIILYNQIDETRFMVRGDVNKNVAKSDCEHLYNGIFDIFRSGIFNKSEFEPFSAGTFPREGNYTPSADKFPKSLWKKITSAASIR